MGSVLKTQIIPIGNSRGVRIPKVWLEQLDLGPDVEMALQADQIVIRPARRARAGWREQFRALAGRCWRSVVVVHQACDACQLFVGQPPVHTRSEGQYLVST